MRRLHAPDLPAQGEFRISGDEAHHLVRVLRGRPGDRFGVFDGRGREVEAELLTAGRGDALLRIVGAREPRRPGREVVLLTAVPRGQRMEWLVEKCTEAGVARVVPLVTARGVRDRASGNTLRRWRRAALEAAKQCGRADVPDVDAPVELVAALAAGAGRTLLLADPTAGSALGAVLPASGGVALLVGPEGGFDDAETEAATAAGAIPFGLGSLILRIETAALVATHTAARG